jgi:hypothetical protein
MSNASARCIDAARESDRNRTELYAQRRTAAVARSEGPGFLGFRGFRGVLQVLRGSPRIEAPWRRPGANVGLGIEYYLRTFAIKSAMNVHILSNDRHFAELDGATLSAFTWTFGLNVPF